MTGGWGLGWPQGYKKLRLSVLGFRLVDFFADPPSLAQMTFTQCNRHDICHNRCKFSADNTNYQ